MPEAIPFPQPSPRATPHINDTSIRSYIEDYAEINKKSWEEDERQLESRSLFSPG